MDQREADASDVKEKLTALMNSLGFRKFMRYRAEVLSLKYKTSFFSAGKEGRVLNIGLGGIKFIADERFIEGRKLTLRIMSPKNGAAITIKAKVIWMSFKTAEGTKIGCQFLRVNKESKSYLEYLIQTLPNKK